MRARDLLSVLLEWLAGLMAAVTGSLLLKKLLEEGDLTALGWAVLLVSATVFLLLLVRLARFESEEDKRHRRMLSSTPMAESPEQFIRTAPTKAEELVGLLGREWTPSGNPSEDLSSLSDLLKERGSSALRESPVLEGVSAYLGELLREHFGGQWRARKVRGVGEAVVVVGKGRSRHEISPSRWVLRTIEEPAARLEDVYRNEESELQ